MKALQQHWEKLVLVVILVIVLLVIGKTLASGSDHDIFEVKEAAKEVAESALVGIPGLVENAAKATPALARNFFTHDWLQRSTANQQALTKKWGLICDETGSKITYRSDADGDGIPNEWEQKYGLDWTNPADGEEDPDKDTFTNKQEYELSVSLGQEVDPKDPTSPNVVAQDWRISKIYYPERPLQLNRFTKDKTLNFTYGGKPVSKVEITDKQFETKEGKIFFIEKIEEITEKNTAGTKDVFGYKVTLKDGDTGEVFSCQKSEKSLESYGEAELVSKEDANKKTLVKVDSEIEVPMVKKNGTVTKIDVEGKTVTVKVNDIEYPVSE